MGMPPGRRWDPPATESIGIWVGDKSTCLMGKFKAVMATVGPVLEKSGRALWVWIRAVKRSVIVFGITMILGLLGMGILGIALYYPVVPVLWLLRFPGMAAWHGDWVWPVLIGAGMAWSFGFLIAGEINRRLERRQTPSTTRRWIYFGVLWCWDLVIWALILYGQFYG